MVFVSSTAGQLSWEDPKIDGGAGGGIFTHYLLLGMAGPADGVLEDEEPDGTVTAEELNAYLQREVSRHAREVLGKSQTPIVSPGFDPAFPFSFVEPPEADLRRPVRHAATRFPLLEDPPPDLWGASESGVRARELFLEGKAALESRDLICSGRPRFFDDSGIEYQLALGAFHKLQASFALAENPWVRLYRGLALARIRAYAPAIEDLESASTGFEKRWEYDHVQIARRVLDAVQRWAAEGRRESVPAVADPRCGAAASRTVCQLWLRTAWDEIPEAALEPQLARLTGLFDRELADPLSPWDLVVPRKEIQRECVELVAKERLSDARAGIDLYELLLADAREDDVGLLVGRYVAGLYGRLVEAGSYGEAREVLAADLELLTPAERVRLGPLGRPGSL